MSASGQLCTLSPVEPGHATTLREKLSALPGAHHSPFARVTTAHFARWVVVDALPDRHGAPLHGHPAYLLFAGEFDGGRGEFLEALRLRLPIECDEVWGHCTDYPGAATPEFDRYLLRHAVEPGFSFLAYPQVDVADVRASDHLRDRLAGFAVSSRALSGAALQQAWLAAFGRRR